MSTNEITERLRDARERNHPLSVAKALVELFAVQPDVALGELAGESPHGRLRFLMRLRKITTRELARQIGSEEHYVSRCFTKQAGLRFKWTLISKFLGVPQTWLATGQWSPELVSILKSGNIVSQPASPGNATLNPSDAHSSRYQRFAERRIIPVEIGEPAFGYTAGAVLPCVQRQFEIGDRVIFRMQDQRWLARWIILPDASQALGQPCGGHLVAMPNKAEFTQLDSSSAHMISALDIQESFVVFDWRDRLITPRCDPVNKASAEAIASLPDDAENGGAVGPP